MLMPNWSSYLGLIHCFQQQHNGIWCMMTTSKSEIKMETLGQEPNSNLFSELGFPISLKIKKRDESLAVAGFYLRYLWFDS